MGAHAEPPAQNVQLPQGELNDPLRRVYPPSRVATQRGRRWAYPRGLDRLPEATTLQEFLQLEPLHQVNPAGHRFSALVSWLVAHARPAITVELGPAECTSLFSTCAAVRGIDGDARCLAVRLPTSEAAAGADAEVFRRMLAECAERYGDAVSGYDAELESFAALAGSSVDLLHVSLFDQDELGLPDLRPGSTSWPRVGRS